MLDIASLADIAALRESAEVECKLAAGRDGQGTLPKDFWETYSAFANTDGGDVFLGLREKPDGSFELQGIPDTRKVLDELWTCLNNPQKISCNILRESHVRVLEIEGVSLIHIHVPRAIRKQKPVFLKNNPMIGSYRRFNSADVLMDDESVKRMLAEQVEDSRDNEVLKGFGLDDLDLDSFNAYRQIYASLQPDHPWNQVDAQTFLNNIGAWRKDRESGHSGLTRAGLLMFGRLPAIQEAFPNYMLDYQERAEAKADGRWVDRITPDGSWSGNLFDFYRKVIRKLTADLKVPFLLEGDQRQDDTLVHKALREALVNTLVHADYSGRASVFVVKRPDMFGFRNPGLMRVPQEIAIRGSESDCRNRLLHQMFRYIGLGEQAGSGIPKIYQGWQAQHWRAPALSERREPSDQTLLELQMLSLVPPEVLEELRESLGEEVFASLSELERQVLITASIERTVTHARMMSIMDIHPSDLTKLFAGLVEKGLILQEGSGRGTIYFLPEARLDDALAEFQARHARTLGDSSGASEASSGGLGASSGGLPGSSGGLDELMAIAAPLSQTRKVARALVEDTLLQLCDVRPLRLEELEKLTGRSGEFLRKDYLQPLIKARRLRLQYPTKPSHPEQAYITVRNSHDH